MIAMFHAGLALLAAQPSPAEEWHCDNPQAQMEMNACAAIDFERADAELNAEYRRAIASARDADREFDGAGDRRPGDEATLREAQRAWIAFRDAQCRLEGYEDARRQHGADGLRMLPRPAHPRADPPAQPRTARSRSSIAALVLALQAVAAAPPEAAEQELTSAQPVRLAPLPLARALDAYRTICMETFPDPAAFDRAAAASDLGFSPRASIPSGASRNGPRRHGQIILRQAQRRDADARRDQREGRGARRRWLARCDFWVAIEEQMPTAELLAAIGRQLTGGRVQAVEEIVGYSWDLGTTEGQSLKLVYLPSSVDDRLFTLSLQRLGDIRPR